MKATIIRVNPIEDENKKGQYILRKMLVDIKLPKKEVQLNIKKYIVSYFKVQKVNPKIVEGIRSSFPYTVEIGFNCGNMYISAQSLREWKRNYDHVMQVRALT